VVYPVVNIRMILAKLLQQSDDLCCFLQFQSEVFVLNDALTDYRHGELRLMTWWCRALQMIIDARSTSAAVIGKPSAYSVSALRPALVMRR
jgi:hypothetical protein